MKYFFTIFLFFNLCQSAPKNSTATVTDDRKADNSLSTMQNDTVDWSFFQQHWVEAIFDEPTGETKPAQPKRGGWSFLVIKNDHELNNKGGLNCGFGQILEGTYIIDTSKQLLSIHYNKAKSYRLEQKESAFDQKAVFEVIILNETEMVLKPLSEGYPANFYAYRKYEGE